MLVNQKSAYMFTYPPLFDIGNEDGNNKISKLLGNKFTKICKTLIVNASNSGIAWLHYWVDENNTFRYGVVDSRQVIPVWTEDLDRKLKAVLRAYKQILDDGKTYIIYEIWADKECETFAHEINSSIEMLTYYSMINHCVINITNEDGNVYVHDWGRVPFIPFMNNDMQTSDLDNIKSLIDVYDKVYSGFMNDLEDIQEIIFILSGYGGTELKEFLHDLKRFKTVKLDEDAQNPGLSTLTIDIPVEAREKMLLMTRREIFEQGQGIDPQPENYGNASGEALKFMYSLLELKAGLTETEFRIAFEEFVHAVGDYLGINTENLQQTWTRNMIRNDAELVTMCSQSADQISRKTILKNHPFVDDPEAEEKQIEKEQKESQQREEEIMYGNAFSTGNDNPEDMRAAEKGKADKG